MQFKRIIAGMERHSETNVVIASGAIARGRSVILGFLGDARGEIDDAILELELDLSLAEYEKPEQNAALYLSNGALVKAAGATVGQAGGNAVLSIVDSEMRISGEMFIAKAGAGEVTVDRVAGTSKLTVASELTVGKNDAAFGKLVIREGSVTTGAVNLSSLTPGSRGLIHLVAVADVENSLKASEVITVGGEKVVGATSGLFGHGSLWVDGGEVDATVAGVTVEPTGIVAGKARIKGDVAVNGGAIAAGPNGGMGTIGVLTLVGALNFADPESQNYADITGTTYGDDYDTVYVQGNAQLDGALIADVTTTVAPWRVTGGDGDYYMVLRTTGSLSRRRQRQGRTMNGR